MTPSMPGGTPTAVVMIQPTSGLRGPARSLLALAGYVARVMPLTVAVPEGFVSRTIRTEAPQARIIPLPLHGSRAASWAHGAERLVTALRGLNGPVLFHANGLSALNLAGPAALALAAPVLIHFHAYEITGRNRVFVETWRRLGVRMSFFPVSAFSRGLLEAAGIRTLVRGILPNPIEPGAFATERTEPHRPFRVGWMGSPSPRKGLHHLVRIAAMLRDEDVEWHLYGVDVAGSGTPYVESCRSEIERLGLGGRLRWCGRVERPAAAYAQMDALLFPSVRESFGRVAIEAMASGLPVVATRVSGAEEVVWDGVSGTLFDPYHLDEGAEQLRRLASDRASWERMSAAAVGAAGRFDVAAIGPMLERFYGDVLRNGHSAASSIRTLRPTRSVPGGGP